MSIDNSGNLHAGDGKFAGHIRTADSGVTLTMERPLPGPIDVRFGDVRHGDEILGDAGESYGFTIGTSVTDGVERVLLHDGSRVRLDENATLTVRRRTEPLPFDADSHDYWGQVAALRDPNQDVAVLEQVSKLVCEDDWMLAVVQHGKATPEIIDRAARHNSLVVRSAAIDNPNTWTSTLVRIRGEAEDSAAEEQRLIKAEGINPNTVYRQQTLMAYQSLAGDAADRLARLRDGR